MKKVLFLSLVILGPKWAFASNSLQPVFLPATTAVSSAPAAGIVATVTISTPVATSFSTGLYTYVTNIHIESLGEGTTTTCTSTNLPGNLSWTFGVPTSTSTVQIMDMQFANPLAATNTAVNTVVSCPATVGAKWNVIVGYYQAP